MGKWKKANILEKGDRRANKSEIWNSGMLVEYIRDNFDLKVWDHLVHLQFLPKKLHSYFLLYDSF